MMMKLSGLYLSNKFKLFNIQEEEELHADTLTETPTVRDGKQQAFVDVAANIMHI